MFSSSFFLFSRNKTLSGFFFVPKEAPYLLNLSSLFYFHLVPRLSRSLYLFYSFLRWALTIATRCVDESLNVTPSALTFPFFFIRHSTRKDSGFRFHVSTSNVSSLPLSVSDQSTASTPRENYVTELFCWPAKVRR